MNTIKIIIHGTGTMSSILKNVIETEEDLEVSGFADDLTNEKGDIIIDFSHFSRIPNMLNFAVNNNIPIVICTTGYDDKILSQIKEASSKIPILLSSNTSIGINLMNDLVSKMAENLNGFDIEIIETHHKQKIDAPSGTALMLADAINEELDNKMKYEYDRHSKREKRSKSEIGIHAVRGGTIVGEHEIMFAGRDEIITLSHSARSKEIFAVGAVNAAVFMNGKGVGMYQMSDLLD